MEQEFYIYQITCNSTNKSYIGQTQKYKFKNGKPYQYGITGRWCDHVSSAKRSNAPFHVAIREHGLETFTHRILETVSEKDTDVRERYWISTLNTIVPDGYNVMAHSRCKHRDLSDVGNLYPDASAVELKQVNNRGVPTLVYVYVDTPTGRKRLTFGQSKDDTFETALESAQEVVNQYRERGVPVLLDKRSRFIGQQLKRIRLVPFNKTMVAIYITDEQNDQTRICFGGKHVSFEDAKQQANEFICGLSANCVENNLSNKSATGDSHLG
jgi:group I intron endonuclease